MIRLPKPQKFTTRLSSIEKVSHSVYLERFELLEPKTITFLAGQTVMLYISPGINRSMSIASPPQETGSLLLAHDVTPMGPYSKWTLGAKVGDTMAMMGPMGMFILDKESPRKKVCVATGSGIAPFYGMVKDYLSTSGTAELSLYWGVRHEDDLFWHKEFESLAVQYPRFHFILTLSQPSASWQGKKGHVQEHVFSGEQNLTELEYYLCGNKNMVADMRTKLQQAGVAPTQIRSELFH